MQALTRCLSHLGASSSVCAASGAAAAAAARRALAASAAEGGSGGDAFDQALLPFLVCPLDKTPLRYDAAANELVNDDLGVAYPIRGGIPRLLPAEGRMLDGSSGGGGGGSGGAAAASGTDSSRPGSSS